MRARRTLFIQADARHLPLRDQSVQCVVTSPPYWGLRDYGQSRQIGREASPEQYVRRLVRAFREVKRVLRDDGTLWLNLGDSYAGSGRGGNPEAGTKQGTNRGSQTVGVLYGREPVDAEAERLRIRAQAAILARGGIKRKDLVGIPWMVAFALRADGWYLRADIIWSKPNPMPESVTDRPTRAHEYLFLLTKSPKYVYDYEAIKEAAVGARRVRADRIGGSKYVGKNEQSVDRRKVGFNARWATKHSDGSIFTGAQTRNRRTVWSVTPQPFHGAHFAVFPEALVEPCLLAGSKDGDIVIDPFCGSGTVGVVAARHKRLFIGCDLSGEYVSLARRRARDDRRKQRSAAERCTV